MCCPSAFLGKWGEKNVKKMPRDDIIDGYLNVGEEKPKRGCSLPLPPSPAAGARFVLFQAQCVRLWDFIRLCQTILIYSCQLK